MSMRCRAAASFFSCVLVPLILTGCVGTQTVAPIETRSVQWEKPAAPPPVAPPAAPAPSPSRDTPIVRALPDTESPQARAIPIPEESAEAIPLPPAAGVTLPAVPGTERAPAVAELLAKADRSTALGEHDVARANLERAVKIAPRDAELWQRLAMLSYAQGDWAQAKALAERSNSFATPGSALATRNWTLIGNAELKLGNQSAAAAAFERSGATHP